MVKTHEIKEKADDALHRAAIAVLNGMSLMAANNYFKSQIKTDGTSELAAYNKIRHNVVMLCRDRNRSAFDKLQIEDEQRPKKAKKQSSDISYETLQLNSYLFLTSDEITWFEGFLESASGVGIDDLIKQRVEIEKRVGKAIKLIEASGVTTDRNLKFIKSLREAALSNHQEMEDRLAGFKSSLFLSKAAERFKANRKYARFMEKRSK